MRTCGSCVYHAGTGLSPGTFRSGQLKDAAICHRQSPIFGVKQICPIAFKVLSLEQITANVFQPNIASIRVLLKNGFKYKSAIPNAVIKDGNVYDLLIYVLTEETR